MKSLVIAILCLAIGGAIGAFVVWKESAKPNVAGPDVRVNVELDIVCSGRVSAPGPEIPLQAKVPGQVTVVHVKDGDVVQAGSTVLFELDDTQYRIKADGYQAAVEGAKATVRELEKVRDTLPQLIDMRQISIQAAGLQTELARKVLRGLRDSSAKDNRYDLTSEIDAATIRVDQALLQETYENQQLALLKRTDTTSKIEQALALLSQANAEHKAALEAVADCKVKAPMVGTVLQVLAGVGSQAAPGSPLPLAVIVPFGRLIVRAELDQEHLGKVVSGQSCKFKDETRADSATWEGQVLQVNKQVRRPRTFLLEPGEGNDVRTVEVVIEPKANSSKEELLIGQRVRVRFSKIE